MHLLGLHHITAIASDAAQNVAFYTRVLGLRLVKQTVNFDDPSTYHLYYGDSVGTPGSILTFFPWSGLRRGRPGTGQAYATSFSVPVDALPFWEQRLRAHGLAPSPVVTRFGEHVLSFADPDGLLLEIVATSAPDPRIPWAHPEIPAAFGLRGFHGVTLALTDATATQHLLTSTMSHRVIATEGTRVIATEGTRTRLASGDDAPGTYVDLLVDPTLPRGSSGGGTVHHVAFRTANDATQAADHAEALSRDLHPSPIIDRNYFHSIYYREPEGILFEIATDPPGFTIDEPAETLGQKLQLPLHYESHRAQIEANLPALF